MSNFRPEEKCPACKNIVEVSVRNCGCMEYSCGAVQTCEDYHHGCGTFLDDCLEAGEGT